MQDLPAEDLLRALQDMALSLQNSAEPREALREMAIIVRDLVKSDGAKVFVVSRTSDRIGIEQLCRTDQKIERSSKLPLEPTRGLADWVVVNGDWLLVPEFPTGNSSTVNSKVDCQTGRNGLVRVSPRLEKEYLDNSLDQGGDALLLDAEDSMLIVPLYSRGETAGALAVWRERAEPYDSQHDVRILQSIVPHIASTCWQVMQIETASSEIKEISKLASRLHNSSTIEKAYQAVAQGVNELAKSTMAVLLHHDPERIGHLYQRATWTSKPEDSEELLDSLRSLHINCTRKAKKWKKTIASAINHRLESQGLRGLICKRITESSGGRAGQPHMVVALLDPVEFKPTAEIFADDLLEKAATSFLHYAEAMVNNHARTHSQRVVDLLGKPEHLGSLGPEEMLNKAAELLKEVTCSSGALVYTGTSGEMKVTCSFPEKKELHGLAVAKPSMTLESIQKRELRRVVDLGDKEDDAIKAMHPEPLRLIRKAFGWRKVRSWLCCPVVQGGRCIGVIKVLTSEKDSFLGKDHEEIAEAVAARTASELHLANRRLLLEELNNLASNLTFARGEDLAEQVLKNLEKWALKFVKPNSKVAVYSYMPPDRVMIVCQSRGLGSGAADLFGKISKDHTRLDISWNAGRHSRGNEVAAPKGFALAAAPFLLPEKGRLEGHLFMLNSEGFSAEDLTSTREAAREIGIVLNAERLRRDWRQRVGRFRHAVLGPVQGVTSAARALGRLAESNTEYKELVEVLKRRVEEEAEIVRLWRENQRLYMTEEVKIRKRTRPLRPVFDRCIERYREGFIERRMELKISWEPKGALEFSFDEDAIDIALSNLLDNARKYGFFNRRITVGARSTNDFIEIWVEDIGHYVPERLQKEIYHLETRIDWEDPLRTIEGEGLGLPMAAAIVKAHGGRLYHSCLPAGSGSSSGDKAPFRVKFAMELPTRWGQ